MQRQMMAFQQEQFDYAKEQQAAQQQVVDVQREQFESFQFSNPFATVKNPYADLQTDFRNIYEGMENPFEDLTVNMQAAEFQAEQGTQQRANILAGLSGAAGSSGIASLAQALSNQGALQTRQISADIGQQEAANQRLAAQGAQRTQAMQLAGAERARGLEVQSRRLVAQGAFKADTLRRQGEAAVQQAEFGRESTLLGAEYGLLAGANQAFQGAVANQMAGYGMQSQMYGAQAQGQSSMIGAGVGAVGAGLGGYLAGGGKLAALTSGTGMAALGPIGIALGLGLAFDIF